MLALMFNNPPNIFLSLQGKIFYIIIHSSIVIIQDIVIGLSLNFLFLTKLLSLEECVRLLKSESFGLCAWIRIKNGRLLKFKTNLDTYLLKAYIKRVGIKCEYGTFTIKSHWKSMRFNNLFKHKLTIICPMKLVMYLMWATYG